MRLAYGSSDNRNGNFELYFETKSSFLGGLTMVKVRLSNVTKKFDEVVAVDEVSLDIDDGEFFTFLGPSGCGKTTTMRIIAGLEFPSEGIVFYDENDVTQLPSFKRNTGMVFQNYALWPHMTVSENVAYGLEIRKVSKAEVKKRVDDVLTLVKLTGMGDRFPNQLSGGQQQRVALARVLVINPDILLLDEPLSNLDAKLRVEMREEIKDIQKKLGITTIYVTHDQEEAMAVSDRLAVQDYGKIRQVGTPQEIYNLPTDLFIATFIGRGAILEGVVESVHESIEVNVEGSIVKGFTSSLDRIKPGDRVACVLRPENFEVKPLEVPCNVIEGTVEWSAFIGSVTEVKLRVGDKSLLIEIPSELEATPGKELKVYIAQDKTIVLPWEELE
jgi:ABC-type Fe3+/spermidine/putrescine transport system ATPase subunit